MTRFRFRLKGGYCIGSLTVPTDIGSLSIQTVGASKAEALMRAATVAQRISEDPVMAALLPPQATVAIAAAKALSVAARRGPDHLKRLWSQIKGPGKKRLAAALHEEATTEDIGSIRYQTRYRGVRLQNRGAWQEWEDPYHDLDEDDYDDDAEGYEDDYDGVVLSDLGRGRRPYRSKSKRRRKRDDVDLPEDEEAPPEPAQGQAFDESPAEPAEG